jgi:hypothetical protein
MSFTVQEARAAFLLASLPYPHHVGGPDFKQMYCENSVGAQIVLAHACDLNVQAQCLKENRNVRKEIPQRIN